MLTLFVVEMVQQNFMRAITLDHIQRQLRNVTEHRSVEKIRYKYNWPTTTTYV